MNESGHVVIRTSAGLHRRARHAAGERGNPLSAGQRQRLGLARLFLRRPEVLIVDKGTSSLDRDTEQRILANLRRHMAGRILLFVTHRQDVAAGFDRIVSL